MSLFTKAECPLAGSENRKRDLLKKGLETERELVTPSKADFLQSFCHIC